MDHHPLKSIYIWVIGVSGMLEMHGWFLEMIGLEEEAFKAYI